MSINLLETIATAFGDEIVEQASPFLGESEQGTESALGMLLPTLLSGLAKQGSTFEGASRLIKTLSGAAVDSGVLTNLAGLFSGGKRTDSLLALGTDLVRGVFGDKVGSLLSTVASLAGIKSSSVSKLLYMAAPLVFGYLKKLVSERGLDAAGLMSLLGDQKGFLWGKVDDRITGPLGLGSFFTEPAASPPGTAYRGEYQAARREEDDTSLWSKLWPWLALLAGLVAATAPFRSCQRTEETSLATTPAVAPAPTRAAPKRAPRPVTVLPAKVYFDVGAAAIGPEGRKTIADLISTVKAHDLTVAITGYTDRTGDVDQNIELAKQRALAVRDALIDAGVTEDQIVMRPPLTITTTGSGSDAEARRVEISRAN